MFEINSTNSTYPAWTLFNSVVFYLHHLLSDVTLAKRIKNIIVVIPFKTPFNVNIFMQKKNNKPGKVLKLKYLVSGLFDIDKTREQCKLHYEY